MMVAGKLNEYNKIVLHIDKSITNSLTLKFVYSNNQYFVIADDKGDLSMYWLAHKNEENTCQVLEDDLGSGPNLESRSQEDDTLCYDNTNHASGEVVKYVLYHSIEPLR